MEWIRVSDGLPAEYQDVLLYQEHGGVFIGWLEEGKWVVDYTFVEGEVPHSKISGNVDQDEITHWRCLPPNPQWDFFEPELKTCADWLFECKRYVKVLSFGNLTHPTDFEKKWSSEKVTKDEFIKRLMTCEIERLN